MFTGIFTGSLNGTGPHVRAVDWGGSARVARMARGSTPRVEVNSQCFTTGDYYRGSEATVQVAGGDNCGKGKVKCNSGVGATRCYQCKVGSWGSECVDAPSWKRLN